MFSTRAALVRQESRWSTVVCRCALQRLGERAAQGRCLAHVQRLSDRKADGAQLFVGVHFKDSVSVLHRENV